jgi:hypothetical protein
MQSLALILILLPTVTLLQCSTYYDYTGDTVLCKSACPPSSRLQGNKCLLKTQYLMGNSVQLCQRGWVDDNNSICCPKTYYISLENNAASCLRCHTRVYGTGRICCPGSHYADFSTQEAGKCTPMGMGACGELTMKSMFKVCCPNGLFYNIQ